MSNRACVETKDWFAVEMDEGHLIKKFRISSEWETTRTSTAMDEIGSAHRIHYQ